ncbi:hypothetical protein [Bradyrhizobium sp. 154]|uniref:hypothetical protein n=1 Tax=unclassified Bradyrhizobium TaxID=2631580 RepID=UPI00320B45D9
MAEAFGVRCKLHIGGNGVAVVASLRLLAVLPPHMRSSSMYVARLLVQPNRKPASAGDCRRAHQAHAGRPRAQRSALGIESDWKALAPI